MRKKTAVAAILFLAAYLVWLHCGSASMKNEYKSILRTAFKGDPITLDPRKGGDAVSSVAQFMLFEGLTRFSPTSSQELAVAERVDRNEAATEYTFHLRNSFWSDGKPVTAHDFRNAWLTILNPQFPAVSSHLLYSIKNAKAAKFGRCTLDQVGIEAVDDLTLRVSLEYPNINFLELTSFCVLFPVPSHLVDLQSHWGDSPRALPISNGPFKITEWKRGDRLVFEKNLNYWDAQNVTLDGVEACIIKDGATAVQMFERGDLDFIVQLVCAFPTDLIPHLREKGYLKASPIGGSSLCTFNTQRSPFNNIHMRKAFAFAIDRQTLVSHVTQLEEPLGLSMVAPILKKGKEVYLFQDHQLEEARKELTLGLEELRLTKKDIVIHLTYVKDGSEDKLAQALQSFWMDAFGIIVQLSPREYQVAYQNLRARNYDMGLIGWAAQYNDPIALLERLTSSKHYANYSGWENPHYKELIHAASYVKTKEERAAILQEAENLIAAEMPITCLYHMSNTRLEQPWVEGIHTTEVGCLKLNWVNLKTRES